jgi:O-antigen/teichoic acid export membrane protein
MKILDTVKDWISKNTLRDLGIVFIENVFSKGLNFILVIMIARTLGPEQYGEYSFVTVSILFLSMVFDFSMENSAIRFSGRYPDKSKEIFGAYFLFKTATLVTVFFLILFSPGLIARLVGQPGVEKYLLIILIGCIAESYRYTFTTYLQFQEKFLERAFINSGVYLLRLTSIFILLRLSIFDIRIISLFFALSGVPFVLLFLKQFIGFVKVLFIHKIPKSLLKQILHYAKWMFFASIATQIMTRLDFYLVTSSLSFKEAGLYNSAFQLVFPLLAIQLVISVVFLPKVSKYTSVPQFKNYIYKSIRLSIAIAIFIALILPFCGNIILFLFGDKYLGALGVFKILLISYLFTFLNVMLSLVLYSMGHSKYMAAGAYLDLIVFVVFALIFIPKLGMIGAAWGRFLSEAVYLAFVGICIARVMLRFKDKTAALT